MLASCGGSSGGTPDPQPVGLQRAVGRVQGRGQPLQRLLGRSLQDHLQHALQRRRPAAPVARPPPRRQGLEHRHRRDGRGVDRRVRRGRAGSSRGPAAEAAAVRKGTLAGPLATATYKGRLYAAPANTNTQLLWYRKDLVKKPATTWDGLITQASALPTAGRIEIQGAQYEGTTVWFNSLVQSAGGTIVEGTKVTLGPQGLTRGADHEEARHLQGRRPGHLRAEGGPEPARVRIGQRGLRGQLPVRLPEREGRRARDLQEHGLGALPGRVSPPARPRRRSAASTGASAATPSIRPRPSRQRRACATRQNQEEAAIKGGLPPTLASLYSKPSVLKAYPFAALIRKQVATAAVPPGHAGLRRRLAGHLQERLAAIGDPAQRLRERPAVQAL